ncbi:Hypothetical protein CINCED_3A021341 [Cinara cedri]|uniref:Uncharacterized protein n=1 Tax=Cinara cedri TaxID=506608 RepID=A0A5E4MUB8_9HEMI|nr:Hypothetical protein CINCED_3A021341 [Cinara cedri]
MMDLKYPIRVRAEIPVIKMGYERVGRLISGLKESSATVQWGLDMATDGVDRAAQLSCVKNRLVTIDRLLCASLDLTELKLPVLTKTPQQVYDESVEYVMESAVRPISEWMDAKFLVPVNSYIDIYLPELDQELRKNGLENVENEEGSRTYQLAAKLACRVKQHAYAEPKYLESLMYTGYEETISLMKTVVSDPKSLPDTVHQIVKNLNNIGTRPDGQSLLLVEMGFVRLRNCASILAQVIEIIEKMIKCYIELIARYKNELKSHTSYMNIFSSKNNTDNEHETVR